MQTPDPDYVEAMRACLRDSDGFHTLVGLMQQRGLRFVAVDGQTDHGVAWSAIVVHGEPETSLLQQVARRVAEAIDAERVRLRDTARDS